MGKMETLTKIFERAWEDVIYDRCSELPSIMDVDEIDAKWIKYLKPILGFTDDISLPADTTELRRILRQAAGFWSKKPTEEAAVLFAIRMVTGNRFRAANFFDFRSQIDHTVITEELEDFDPFMISFPTNKLEGVQGNAGVSGNFDLEDLPLEGGFEASAQFGYLLIKSSTKTPTNIGIYEIDYLDIGAETGKIVGAFPGGAEGWVDWEIIGYAGEYITEVRLVDRAVGTLRYKDLAGAFATDELIIGQDSKAYGTITAIDTTSKILSLNKVTGRFLDNEQILGDASGDALVDGELDGVLNRNLLRILMDLVRPFGERLDVVYINFIDQFLTPGDLDQWTTTGTAEVPSPGGYVKITASGRIDVFDDQSPDWGDQVVAWKFFVDDADTDAIAEFRFFVVDEFNFYYVLVDYNAMDVELWKKVAGSPTQIGSSVSLPILKAGVSEVLRVDALAEGSDTRIRVKIAGDTRIDEKDTPAAFTEGGVAAVANTKDLYVELVEVNVLPTEIDRVGPNP